MLVRRHADPLSFVQSLELHYSVRWHAAIVLVAATLAGSRRIVRLVDPSADTIGQAVAHLLKGK